MALFRKKKKRCEAKKTLHTGYFGKYYGQRVIFDNIVINHGHYHSKYRRQSKIFILLASVCFYLYT